MKVVVLGASNNPDRYSYKAIQSLQNKGHQVYPIHPALEEVLGIKVIPNLASLNFSPDTLTLYVNPEISEKQSESILALNPKRIIFNPGTENASLKQKAEEQGINCLDACTLVLLSTHQF